MPTAASLWVHLLFINLFAARWIMFDGERLQPSPKILTSHIYASAGDLPPPRFSELPKQGMRRALLCGGPQQPGSCTHTYLLI